MVGYGTTKEDALGALVRTATAHIKQTGADNYLTDILAMEPEEVILGVGYRDGQPFGGHAALVEGETSEPVPVGAMAIREWWMMPINNRADVRAFFDALLADGINIHPDCEAADYSPPLPPVYDTKVERCLEVSDENGFDVYEVCIEATQAFHGEEAAQ